MLDKQNAKIIKKLNKLCENGSYKVFDIDDLIKIFGVNKDVFDNNISYLKNNDYIDIKYKDDTAICLCLLPKARAFEEEANLKTYSHKNLMQVLLLSGIFAGIMAFLGAFVAVLIIK